MSAGTALITGISGQDGSYLAEALLAKGYEVHGLVRSGHLGLAGHLAADVETHEGDLRDGESLERAVRETSPDEVYHLAGVTMPGRSWENPAAVLDIVAGGTVRLLDALSRLAADARTFVAGSSEVFGPTGRKPRDEQAPFEPRNPYGAAKAAAVAAARAYRSGRGMWVTAGLLYNHESPRRPIEFVTRKVTWHAAAIALGKARELHIGNLDAHRDWGYAPEYMEGAWRALQAHEPSDYVFATGVQHSVRELVEIAFARAGLSVADHIVVDRNLVSPGHANAPAADPRKARQELGWKAGVSFEELVNKMVDADLEALAS